MPIEAPGGSTRPEIADIEVAQSGTLVVKGGKQGKTTLLVWTADKVRHSYLIDVR